MKRHETIPLLIRGEIVPVDVKIAPVVRWLNGFPSVRTLWSCEGTPGTPIRPYVMFRCLDQSDLLKVLDHLWTWQSWQGRPVIDFFGKIVVDTSPGGSIRYTLEFDNTVKRHAFVLYLPRYPSLTENRKPLFAR